MNTTLTMSMEEVSVTLHPDFTKPRDDWGVIPAHTTEEYWDADDVHWPAEQVPENRSRWKPEYDGKSMSDFWDHERGEFMEDSPCGIQGITTFLRPVMTRPSFDQS